VKRNPKRPFEDMDGNWIGLGKIKKYEKNYPSGYKNPDIETGEIERLEKLCRDGDSKACNELEKLMKDNDDFLEHLMAIADYDEHPPKLKEPSDKD
jgi:hypothetical protein